LITSEGLKSRLHGPEFGCKCTNPNTFIVPVPAAVKFEKVKLIDLTILKLIIRKWHKKGKLTIGLLDLHQMQLI